MNLVLLPHHNTITSLQKLQKSFVSTSAGHVDETVFLPSYPLVCILTDKAAVAGQKPDSRDAQASSQMRTLKDMLKNAQGLLEFSEPQVVRAARGCITDNPDTLILPVKVPFLHLVEAAGFTPVNEPYIVLGSWYAASADKAGASDKAVTADKAAADFQASGASELPVPSRSFRLALMQTTPLSEAGPAAAFSWKYTDAFWVKLG